MMVHIDGSDARLAIDIDGGTFWRLVSSSNSEVSDPTLATPVKKHGVSFNYNRVQKEVLAVSSRARQCWPRPIMSEASIGGALPSEECGRPWGRDGTSDQSSPTLGVTSDLLESRSYCGRF
jgi:hypothetical protein